MSILHLTECVGGIVIHEKTGKIAIVSKINGARHENGKPVKKWSLPKGGREADESQEEALARELEEEAGITRFKIQSVIGSFSRHKITPKEDFVLKRITLFHCTTKQNELRPVEKHKHPDALWIPPKKSIAILTFDEDREFLRRALSDIFEKEF